MCGGAVGARGELAGSLSEVVSLLVSICGSDDVSRLENMTAAAVIIVMPNIADPRLFAVFLLEDMMPDTESSPESN